jgi:hypothetical protein
MREVGNRTSNMAKGQKLGPKEPSMLESTY